ncbi:hypothetical protein BH09ACT10_BH09ACT10_29350 [soil metagenome]
MSRLSLALAMTVVVGSLMWGTAILSSDVPDIAVPAAESGTLACGGIYGSLVGRPLTGGELPYPDDWLDQCRAAAKGEINWTAAVPAIAGPLALIYLAGAFVMAMRRVDVRVN